MAEEKSFKKKKITEFLELYSSGDLEFTNERIKLCSSDDFNDLSESFKRLLEQKHSPIMISQVGGFYVMASLAGHAASLSRTKPSLLFFDKKTNNIANAIYNTLLMQACSTKERYVVTLFGLSDKDIIKALDSNRYTRYIVEVYLDKDVSDKKITSSEVKAFKKAALKKYAENPEEYDQKIARHHKIGERAVKELRDNFDIAKIKDYIETNGFEYNSERHREIITKTFSTGLSAEHKKIFTPLVEEMTAYLAKGENYKDLVVYLVDDMQKNSANHILCDALIYNGYKSLISSKGNSAVHFVPGVDISTENGVKKLERILTQEGFLSKTDNGDSFPIDIAFIPHIDAFQEAYPFIKSNVEQFIKINRGTDNKFSMHSTATLNVRTRKSIGAEYKDKEEAERVPLTNLEPIPDLEGIPNIVLIAGGNIGNIYSSMTDLQNVIDMAIADKVDTVVFRGLIYSTYYHNDTKRRGLIDPKYDTLDKRLKAAREIIEKLNSHGIKVVYQMSAEEDSLADDMFTIYTREQGVVGNNFLAREDLKSKFDWVRPIIAQQLIPYLIRSGEDSTNFFTDEETQTRVSEMCHALKNYTEGLHLGRLKKQIKPEYLEDTDMFKVVYSDVLKYGDDPSLAVDLLSRTKFSNGQYAKPSGGVGKTLKVYKSKVFARPQLLLDGSHGAMEATLVGNQMTVLYPQMVDDSDYYRKELLPGIKDKIQKDPTYARVNKESTNLNYPGSWMLTGDIRTKFRLVPYFERVRETMEYVQKTGEGFKSYTIFHLNDWQIGSHTERLESDLKALDYVYYNYPDFAGIIGNGDSLHGYNYKGFANESRHLGSISTSQQEIDFSKVINPWMASSFGVVDPLLFVGDYPEQRCAIDWETSAKILLHLRKIGAIDSFKGKNHNNDLVKREIDYRKLDLELPKELMPYETIIREKLSLIRHLEFIHTKPGNHCMNSDWDKKGFNLIKQFNRELELLKGQTGSDIELSSSEFIVNDDGDIVQAPYSGCKTINGMNIVYAHAYEAASGTDPLWGMSKQFDRADMKHQIHCVYQGHLHIYQAGVINNRFLSITGSGAGESGYEHNLGFSSRPLYVISRFLPDGRIAQETITPRFLKDYQIQNPYVRSIGLDKHIESCLTEDATYYGFNDEPGDVQPMHQRQLKRVQNRRLGPKVD